MRVRRRFSEQYQRAALVAELSHFARHILRELGLGHPDFQRFERGAVRLERRLIRELHDLDLVRRLHAATAIDHVRRGGELQPGTRERELGEHEGARARIERQSAGAEPEVAQCVGDEQLGILIFLPHPDVEPSRDLVFSALLLERGRNHDRPTRDRQQKREQSFAAAPFDPGEVGHVRARLDQHRRKIELAEQAARSIAPLLALGFADWGGSGYGGSWMGDGSRVARYLEASHRRRQAKSGGEGGGTLDEFAAAHFRGGDGVGISRRIYWCASSASNNTEAGSHKLFSSYANSNAPLPLFARLRGPG